MVLQIDKKVALIGFGSIARILVKSGLKPEVVLVRKDYDRLFRKQYPGLTSVSSIGDLLDCEIDIVVECASQQAVREFGEAVLNSGTDLLVVSTGVFADNRFLKNLLEFGTKSGSRIIIPAGAIAGIDGLSALSLGGLEEVRYISKKPPNAWEGTPAEELYNLKEISESTVIFSGRAAQAATQYPKNANLAVTVALAGIGVTRTQVELVADPDLNMNQGRIEASGRLGKLVVDLTGSAAPDNPKTSEITAFSILHCLMKEQGVMVL